MTMEYICVDTGYTQRIVDDKIKFKYLIKNVKN